MTMIEIMEMMMMRRRRKRRRRKLMMMMMLMLFFYAKPNSLNKETRQHKLISVIINFSHQVKKYITKVID